MRKLLAVIDMQNDFIDGSLGTEEAVKIVPIVKEKIEQAIKENVDIVFTRDTHHENYMETQEGKKLPVKHCIENEYGWEIAPSLKAYSNGRIIFDKPTFGSDALMSYAREKTYDEIELIGLCTDICVISNAMLVKAALPESKIIVDSKACAGVTVESHNNALEAMKMCQIEVV